MNKYIGLLFFLLVITSCESETTKRVDISEIEMEISVDRFEQKFYNANEESLGVLKKEYPFLFPVQNADSIWLNRIKDPKEKELFEKSNLIFNNFSDQEEQIKSVFKYVKYYHPSFLPPKIITIITNLDYQNNVMYTGDFLFISLDMYLGAEEGVYEEFPYYLSQNYTKNQLPVDIGKAISEVYATDQSSRQFIDLIINEGKKMYQLDCYLPSFSDAQKIGYTEGQISWAEENEVAIWKYFVENKLLFNTDSDLTTRFISEAPFSKFYIDIDKESPGRVGVWLGWQIVRSYMNNNNVTLQQLLQASAEDIFKNSKYKPKK